MTLTEKVYKLCVSMPKSEQFGLVSQMQRAAVSIPSNISEGCQRNSKREFRQFCSIAYGSAAELETQLILASRLHASDITETMQLLDEVQKMLNSLISKLKTNN